MNSITDDLKYQFKTGNTLFQLITVNIAVFVLVNIIRIILLFTSGSTAEVAYSFQEVIRWLSMPMAPASLLTKPWTVLTYMFLHTDIWHVFWNMVILYFFGRLFQEYLGTKKLLPVYIYGGLSGALLAFVAYNTIPFLAGMDAILMGASAGVMSVMLATTTLLPDYSIHLLFIGEIRLKYVAAFYIVLDIIGVSYFENMGGHFAHLGGALFGFVFTKQLRNGNDLSLRFNRLMDWVRSLFKKKKKTKMNVSYKSNTAGKTSSPITSAEKQRRIDEILDKISRSGYESLSREEKDELFNMSK